jgi:hypothetical protein
MLPLIVDPVRVPKKRIEVNPAMWIEYLKNFGGMWDGLAFRTPTSQYGGSFLRKGTKCPNSIM